MVQFFPHVIKVGEIILTLPVSNAFSRLKLVKTCLRNRLQNGILYSRVRNSVAAWLSAKPRRKLPKSLSQSDKEKQRLSLSGPGEPVALTRCSTQT